MIQTEHEIELQDRDPLEALVLAPVNPIAALVFAHGAGAGMEHAFMANSAARLADRGIATLRFNFPYKTAGRSYPDRPKVLKPAIAAAIEFSRRLFDGLPLFAGGKSMGGRLTADAVAEGVAGPIAGLICYGYPLHAPGKEGVSRAALLADLTCPMLFLQGTRDKLARLDLIESIVDSLDSATLYQVDEGDHSFKVPKRTGLSNNDVLDNLADTAAGWIRRTIE